jgi:hypothetical protein
LEVVPKEELVQRWKAESPRRMSYEVTSQSSKSV